MKEFTYVVVFITAASTEEAQNLAEVLLVQRKAACVNIVPQVHSRFWWKGQLESDEETLLIVKTKAFMLNEISRLVREVHSYDVPEIIALPIIGGNQEYLDWIGKEVK